MRRAQRIGMVAAVAAVLCAATAGSAGACSIAAVPLSQQLAGAAIAFSGTVQQVTPEPGDYALTVTPDRVVKGTLPGPTVTLTTHRSDPASGSVSSCDMAFAPGQRAVFLLGSAAPPWPVGLGNVLGADALDAVPAPSEFHATAITGLLAQPGRRTLRLTYRAPSCAALAVFVHERAGVVRVGLRTAATPSCRAATVVNCAAVVLRAPLGARTLHPAYVRRRRLAGTGLRGCPRVGAFAS